MNKFIKSGLVILAFLLYPVFIILPLAIINSNINQLADNLKIIYLISISVIFMASLLIIYKKDMINYYYDFKKNGKEYIRTSLKYWYFGLVIMVVANALISAFTPNELAENEEMVRELLKASPFYVLFSTIIYAPIVEEIICRKTLKDIIKSKWVFIIASALLFGGAHVLNSLTSLWSLFYIIPYGALGGAFAFAYYKTNNLLTPIFLHCIHNTILITLYLIVL